MSREGCRRRPGRTVEASRWNRDMKKRWTKQESLGAVVLLFTAMSAGAAESAKTVVGRVTSFTRESLALKTDSGEAVTFTLGPETKYSKWVTQKPLQRSTAADWSFLAAGKRVAVKPAGAERPTMAMLVRIAAE